MEPTTTITIPSDWLEGQDIDEKEIQRALQLGLAQLRQQRAAQETKVVQALLSTRRIRHLSVLPAEDVERKDGRQEPPALPGPSVSEILIAQRRGEL
jgi:hypothetical protein